jgi:hypothetical protein
MNSHWQIDFVKPINKTETGKFLTGLMKKNCYIDWEALSKLKC